MIERCYSSNDDSYSIYGGRGITVCEEWKDFKVFCKWARSNGYDRNADKGECTIDRIDNDKGYSPNNCRWVSIKVQARNRRNNRVIEFNGQRRTLTEWAELTDQSKTTLRKRLDSGWSIEDALTRPLMENKSSRYR